MNNLQLLDQINRFYRMALLKSAAPPGFSMPDDPEEGDMGEQDLGLYPEIVDAANKISNEDIREEVLLIAELYKKSLEINGGYNFVNKGVSNLVNMLDDEDDEEQMAVEDLLNKISRDLRARSKTTPMGDTDTALEGLKQVKNDFNTRLISEDLEQETTPFEAGLEQYEEGAKGVFDYTGGVNPEVGATKGRGYRIERRSYKDWAQSFEDERQRFEHELTVPELQLSRTGLEARRNTATRSNLNELVKLLGEMSVLTREAIQLEADLQAAPDPAKQARLEEIRLKLKNDQNKRLSLKKSLRNYQFIQQNKGLQEELKTARPEDKLLIELRMQLNELMRSPDRGKDVEAKWLRAWINSISGGHSLPPDQVERIKQRIREGADKKIKATFLHKLHVKEEAKKLHEDKGGTGVPLTVEEKKRRSSRGERATHDWNLEKLKFDQLLIHLTQRLATARVVAKQSITHVKTEKGKIHNELKPFVDDVAKAATKKDQGALVEASRKLRGQIHEKLNQPIQKYIRNVWISNFFYKMRDALNNASPLINTSSSLTYSQILELDEIAKYTKRLIAYYQTNYPDDKDIFYQKSVDVLKQLVNITENRIREYQ